MKYVQSCIFINWSIYVNSFKLTTKERFDKSLLSKVWQLQVILFNTPLPVMAHYHLKPQFNTPPLHLDFVWIPSMHSKVSMLNLGPRLVFNNHIQMVGSHDYFQISPRVSISSSFTIENDAITGLLDHFWTIKGISGSVCGSKLSVSSFEKQFQHFMTLI